MPAAAPRVGVADMYEEFKEKTNKAVLEMLAWADGNEVEYEMDNLARRAILLTGASATLGLVTAVAMVLA